MGSRLIVSRCTCEAISGSRPVLLPAALGMSIVVYIVHAWVRASPFPTALRDQGRDVVVMCLAVGVPFSFPLRCGTGHSEAERGSTAGRNSAVRRGRSFESLPEEAVALVLVVGRCLACSVVGTGPT